MASVTRFFYLRDRKGFPRVCVARTLVNNTVVFGYSVHNPNDRFNRALAREIAANRMNMEIFAESDSARVTGGIVQLAEGEHPMVTVCRALVGEYELANTPRQNLPSWRLVSTLARRWLDNDANFRVESTMCARQCAGCSCR